MSALVPQSPGPISPSVDRERLLLERAKDMLTDRLAGYSDLELCRKYGLTLGAVEDAIRTGMNEALSKVQEETINTALVLRLAQLDAELADLDRGLRPIGVRSSEAFNSRGEKAWLRTIVSNVPAKVKIKSERRQLVTATRMVLKGRTEDPPDAGRARDLSDIGAIFAQATREVVTEATHQAQERGRLEERLTTEAFVTPNGFEVQDDRPEVALPTNGVAQILSEVFGEQYDTQSNPESSDPDSRAPIESPSPEVPFIWE